MTTQLLPSVAHLVCELCALLILVYVSFNHTPEEGLIREEGQLRVF